MKKIFLLLILISSFVIGQKKKDKLVIPPVICTNTPPKSWTNEVLKFQKELNQEYKSKTESPLRGENFKKFKAHLFFPINSEYLVKAKLVKTENAEPFEIPTSSEKLRNIENLGKFILK